jgi:two-component system, chemotaxis family, protein-glutamate methylesterase/glutaminase
MAEQSNPTSGAPTSLGARVPHSYSAIWPRVDGIVVIAASAGGLEPIQRIIAALPVRCSVAIFVVMHISARPSNLPRMLSRSDGSDAVIFAKHGSPIEAGHIYIAPPDHHMLVGRDSITLNQGPKVNRIRPAADPLFMSAAEAHGQRVLGIVLSGGDCDGSAGLLAIAEHGGTTLVQDPEEAAMPSMPRSAIKAGHTDASQSIEEIARRVRASCSHGSAT